MGDARAAVTAVRLGGGADDRELGRGLVGVAGIGAGEQARAGELLAEQRDALEKFVGQYRGAPVMALSAAKPEPAIVEIVAAVQAVK